MENTKIKSFKKNQMVEVYVNRDGRELKQSLLVLSKAKRLGSMDIYVYDVLTQDGEIDDLMVDCCCFYFGQRNEKVKVR